MRLLELRPAWKRRAANASRTSAAVLVAAVSLYLVIKAIWPDSRVRSSRQWPALVAPLLAGQSEVI